MEGKATLTILHTCFCINGVLKYCLLIQHLIYSSPGSTWSSEEVFGLVFWLLHEKAVQLVLPRVPQSQQSVSARHFPWQGVGSAHPLSAGWCQWDYDDFTQPRCSGCSFPHSLNSREGLDWSCRDFHIHTQTSTVFFPVLPVSPTMRAIHKAYEGFLFSDLLGWLFFACLNGSAGLTMNKQKTHLSLWCRRVKLWERRNQVEGNCGIKNVQGWY